MIIHGKERKFMFTVQVALELAKICPEGNLERLGDVISNGDYTQSLPNIARFIVAMNMGYENAKKFENPNHEVDVITYEEVLNTDFNVVMQILDVAMAAYQNDSKREIKTQAAKGKGKKTETN